MQLWTSVALLSAFMIAVLGGGVHQIPLQLRQNHTALMDLLRSHRYETANVNEAAGGDFPFPGTPLSLMNMFFMNAGFLNVGQPEQTISVDFNIYLSDSYLVDKSADSSSGYDSTQSYAFKKSSTPFIAPDGSTGFWASDHFQIPLTVLDAYRQPFGWINHVRGSIISFTFSTLGLGPVKDSNSFLHTIKQKQFLEQNIYSLYFEP